jgi:hypothetical protein
MSVTEFVGSNNFARNGRGLRDSVVVSGIFCKMDHGGGGGPL